MINLFLGNIGVENSVSDQLNWLRRIFKKIDFTAKESQFLDKFILNIAIEAFLEDDAEAIINFCKKNNKKIIILMTENLSIQHETIYFNDSKLYENSDVFYDNTKLRRINGLIKLIPYTYCYLNLGGFPDAKLCKEIFPNIMNIEVPYPISNLVSEKIPFSERHFDFIFYGVSSLYRRQCLEKIGKKFKLKIITNFIDDDDLAGLIRNSKFSINIPQSDKWDRFSITRYMRSVENRTPLISIGGPLIGSNSSILNLEIENLLKFDIHENIFEQILRDQENYILSKHSDDQLLEFKNKMIIFQNLDRYRNEKN